MPFSIHSLIALLGLTLLMSGCSLADQIRIAPPSFTERVETADQAFKAGRHQEASELYRNLADENRSLALPTHRLGIIAYHSGDLAEAQTQFERSLNRNPDHIGALYNLAMVHLESTRRLLLRHEQLSPEQAADPALLKLRRALEQIATSGTGQ